MREAAPITASLKELQHSDIPPIVELGKESGLSFWSVDSYIEELNNNGTKGFVLVSDKEITGFIMLRFIPPDEAEILNFAVKETSRRKGLGRVLLESAIKQTAKPQNIKKVWLEVRESNSQAIRFYKKFGFKFVGTRKNFYTLPTENALLMKLEM